MAARVLLLNAPVFFGNVLWNGTKLVLRNHGHAVHWFCGHLADLSNMVRLIKTAPSSVQQRRYAILLLSLCSSFQRSLASRLLRGRIPIAPDLCVNHTRTTSLS